LYIYGGWDSTTTYNDLWKYDLVTQTWQEICDSSFDTPKIRFHAASVYKNFMYLCCGYSDTRIHPREMYAFNFEKKKWAQVHYTGTPPCGRSRMRSFVYGDKMYIMGGFDMNTKKAFNDIYEFNFVTSNWKLLPLRLPSPLCQYSVNIWNGILFLLGGYDGNISTNQLFGLKLLQ